MKSCAEASHPKLTAIYTPDQRYGAPPPHNDGPGGERRRALAPAFVSLQGFDDVLLRASLALFLASANHDTRAPQV